MKRILAADIGGTHSRFAHFSWHGPGGLALEQSLWLSTAEAQSFSDLLAGLRAAGFSLLPETCDMAVIAVAGPVEKGVYSRPPFIPFGIDLSQAQRKFGFRRCLLINDFVAQAFACRSPVMAGAEEIIAGEADPAFPLVVVGAGTGLGQAALVPDGSGRYVALASEGAHTSFPFESDVEWAYRGFLAERGAGDPVISNTVVSGKGLQWLHHFLTGESLQPAQVARRLSSELPTLLWMARFYGRACRHYALQMVARGGVYVSGGVAARTPEIVRHPEFCEEFRRSSTMGSLLARIPVFLNQDQESGLWGAALAGAQALGALLGRKEV